MTKAITFRGAECRCWICGQDNEETCVTHTIVTVPIDHQLAKELRPSKKAVAQIERHEQINAAGLCAVRNMPLGSDGGGA